MALGEIGTDQPEVSPIAREIANPTTIPATSPLRDAWGLFRMWDPTV
jgi:hypothetical protein